MKMRSTRLHNDSLHWEPVNYRYSRIRQDTEKYLDTDVNVVPSLEVFTTFEGEGTRLGVPRVLVRLSGCAIGCEWCDTRYSWKVRNPIPVSEMIEQVKNQALGKVTEVSITGGEPLHYPIQITRLATSLQESGLKVSLETSGLILNGTAFDAFNMISMDIKTPSSEIDVSGLVPEYLTLGRARGSDIQFKTVVTCQDDLNWIATHLRELYTGQGMPLIITPGTVAQDLKYLDYVTKLEDTIRRINEWNQGYNIRVIAQQHQLLRYR